MATETVTWPDFDADHPLSKFALELPSILIEAQHNEMYGVELIAPEDRSKQAPFTTLLILQKFLRANANDPVKAKQQLLEALKWRKSFKPLEAKEETFDQSKFGGLGFVIWLESVPDTKNEKDVAAFNIYGAAAKDFKHTFGDADAFVRWRVALMEITLAELHLDKAIKPIPDYGKGPDPYQAIQVHDYLSVSFWHQPAEIKSSSARIIDMFQKYYPETVSYKYFVNVPMIMQWMMAAMKALMSKETIQKMTWMTYGSELYSNLGSSIPKEYGGSGAPLDEVARKPKYDGGPAEGDGSEKPSSP